MNNTKTTKRALLSSVMAMLLCVTMLIGTTFAWFTDSASTAVNKIQAGKLDVALEMKDNSDNWVTAEGKTLQFKVNGQIPADGTQILWEPGCTYELPELRIVNKGNLALKYRIVVNGIVGNAKLLEAIDFTVSGVNGVATATALNGFEGYLTADSKTDAITISGHMKESAGNEYQGLSIDGIGITVVATQYTYENDSFSDQYDKDAVLQVNSKGVGDIPVTDTSVENNAKVSAEKTISSGAMTVTYPAGVTLDNTGVVTGDTDKMTSVEQTLDYVGDTPSAAMTGISIDDGKAVASYELTLPVSTSNDKPVTVKINYTAGLTGVSVYHSGTLLTATANADGESAVYDAATGVLTLTLKHASPIDIIYNTKMLPANAKLVYTLDELEAAVGNLHAGDYIAFGANIVQDKVDTTSGQITFARASDAEGDIEATLDLNGFVFDGQIGGFSFANDGITVNVYGMDKVVADYYEHETGHHMVKASAVFNYSGKTVLKSGLYESNNMVVMAYGGEVVIDDGVLHNTEDGVVIFACNDPAVTINGGTFSCENKGALFVIEPYRTNEGPVITINDGVFDASKGACFLCVDGRSSDAGEVAQVVINGGTFTMPTADRDWAQDGDGILAAGSNRLVIRGGTFNVDPSAYVDSANYTVTKNGSTWTVTAK